MVVGGSCFYLFAIREVFFDKGGIFRVGGEISVYRGIYSLFL